MHCSNLAASGIHEAIYQYKKKEGMEISDELKKKHEIAEKTLGKNRRDEGGYRLVSAL